ncbi:MAG TPA: hypothetical protein VL243_14215 [Vicinamibacterales bacterium]|nr:hypothetical protein [Vicinamibacterales bacterium]
MAFTALSVSSSDATGFIRSAVLTSLTINESRGTCALFSAGDTTMIWMFEREPDEILRLETRYDNDTSEFVLILHRPSGGRQIERFRDMVTFRERLEVLETQLAAERWRQEGTVFLHEGWKLT